MTSVQSAKCTLWVNRLVGCTMAVLCFTLYDLLVWYSSIRGLPWQVCAVILVGFYLCTPAVLYALWCIETSCRTRCSFGTMSAISAASAGAAPRSAPSVW